MNIHRFWPTLLTLMRRGSAAGRHPRLSLPHHGRRQGLMLHAQWRNNNHPVPPSVLIATAALQP